ncbi:MAG: hypothetical protein R3F53_22820 [Gammaproteobacteria bacterium]
MRAGKLQLFLQQKGESETVNQAKETGDDPAIAQTGQQYIFNRHIHDREAISISTSGGNQPPRTSPRAAALRGNRMGNGKRGDYRHQLPELAHPKRCDQAEQETANDPCHPECG